MGNVFQFLDAPRQDPEKKPVEERIVEFGEIYGEFDPETAAVQADRALNVAIPIVSGNARYTTTFPTG